MLKLLLLLSERFPTKKDKYGNLKKEVCIEFKAVFEILWLTIPLSIPARRIQV